MWQPSVNLDADTIRVFKTIRKMHGALMDGFLMIRLPPRQYKLLCLPSAGHRDLELLSAVQFEPACYVRLLDKGPADVDYAPIELSALRDMPGAATIVCEDNSRNLLGRKSKGAATTATTSINGEGAYRKRTLVDIVDLTGNDCEDSAAVTHTHQ